MSARIGEHVRGNVVGYVALFIALSGTAWAAGQIGSGDLARNAVRSKHIKNQQVKTKDIRDAAVNAAKVADGSLTGSDVASDSVGGQQIEESDLGQVPDAANADQLDGIDSTGFGNGALLGRINSLTASGPATEYGSPNGTSVADAVEGEVLFISTQSPMTVQEFRVFIPGGMPGGASRTFTLRVNGTDSAISCTVTSPDFGCTDAANSETMQFGSGLAIEVETVGSPGVQDAAFSLRALSG
jgi:hypothetical protein